MTLPVFHGLRTASYGAVLADPPWAFRIWSGTDNTPHRTVEDHYSTMSIDAICALPVQTLAKPDCALFLWVVDSHLDKAFAVAQSWGFTYKTRAFEWFKGGGIGMGYWTRKQTESVLMFTRGKPARLSKSVRQVIEAPRREHSRKPDEQYERIEALVAGPYCELFAKYRRPGWDGWGNEYAGEGRFAVDARKELTKEITGLTIRFQQESL